MREREREREKEEEEVMSRSFRNNKLVQVTLKTKDHCMASRLYGIRKQQMIASSTLTPASPRCQGVRASAHMKLDVFFVDFISCITC